jgi:hypothetical protein
MKQCFTDWSEGLDDIPWPELRHAYGSAADVPEVLRDCSSSEPDVVEEAIDSLFGNIWHQGTVYQATAHAVPFLVRLVQRPETHQRFMLVALLESIANGSRYQSHTDPELIAAGERDVLLSRSAVERHLDDFIALAADGDAEVRRQIPPLIARIEAGREWLARHAIAAAASERDACVAAHWLLALAFSHPEPGAAAELKSTTLPEDPAVQLGAATLTLFCGGPSEWNAAAQTMMMPFMSTASETMSMPSQGDPLTTLYASGFMGLSGREEHVSAALERLPLLQRQVLITHLCRHLPGLDVISSSMVADTCLSLAFDPADLPASVDALSEEQRVILRQLDRCKNVGYSGRDLEVLQGLQESGVLAGLGIAPRAHW